MDHPGPARTTAQELLLGLRIAVVTIAAAVVLSASLPRKLGVHDSPAPQVAAYLALLVLLAVELVLLVRRREWGRLRLPALAVALAASLVSTWTLEPRFLTTATDWSFGTVGWLAVVLLFNRPLVELAVFLGLHEMVTVTRVLALPSPGRDFVLNLVAGSLGTVGFPLACGIASTALRGIALRAERASAEAAEIRNAEAVAGGLHRARHARLAQLDATAQPLLKGLAEGRLSPDDPAVRRLCLVEAARMRRLLAETDVVEDPVLHELRHGADVAERRGVLIEFTPVGSWPDPGLEVRRALLDGPMAVLATATTRARVSVIGTTESLSISVVADGPGWTVPPHDEVETTIVVDEDTTWVESSWAPAAGRAPYRS